MPSVSAYCLTWVCLTLDVGYLLTAIDPDLGSGVSPHINSMKRQKDMTLKDELPRLVGGQYATGDQWRNNSRKNEEMEPKQKQHPAVDVTGDGSKV